MLFVFLPNKIEQIALILFEWFDWARVWLIELAESSSSIISITEPIEQQSDQLGLIDF